MDRVVNCGSYISLGDLTRVIRNSCTMPSKAIALNSLAINRDFLLDDIATTDNVYSHNYSRKILAINIFDILLYVNDIDIFSRAIGMTHIEFVELTNVLLNEAVLKKSWKTLYPATIIEEYGTDVPFNVKVITIQIIRHLIKEAIDNLHSKRQDKVYQNEVYYVSDNTVGNICVILGWIKTTPLRKEHNTSVLEIINFALQKLNISIAFLTEHIGNKCMSLTLSTKFIASIIPDIHLFVHHTSCDNGAGYFKVSSLPKTNEPCPYRKFISIQLKPYQQHITLENSKKLKQILRTCINQSVESILFDINNKIVNYTTGNWYNHVIDNLINLYYEGTSYLSIEAVEDDIKLYEQLIGMPKKLFKFIVDNSDIFYMLSGGTLEKPVEKNLIKQQMFLALTAGHMVDLLTRCGMVLTEDMFSIIFNTVPNQLHLNLVHTGIIFRHNLKIVMNRYDMCWYFDHAKQEIRIAKTVALQLLCTYFKGLDKIIPIEQLANKRSLPAAYSQVIYFDKDDIGQINYNHKIEYKEYPLPLVVSVREAISNPTPCLYKLQLSLLGYDCIGARRMILTPDSIKINLNTTFTEHQLAVFEYFTGFDCVVSFKQWVKQLIKQDNNGFLTKQDNDGFIYQVLQLSAKSGLSRNQRVVFINEFMFAINMLAVMHRDAMLMGLYAYELIQTIIKPIIMASLHIEEEDFNQLHYYARLTSCFAEVEAMKTYVSDNVITMLKLLYSGIITDYNSVLSFTREREYKGIIYKHHYNYNNIIQHKLKEMENLVIPKQIKILFNSGSLLQLKPWIVSNKSSMQVERLAYTGGIKNMMSNGTIELASFVCGYTLEEVPFRIDINVGQNMPPVAKLYNSITILPFEHNKQLNTTNNKCKDFSAVNHQTVSNVAVTAIPKLSKKSATITTEAQDNNLIKSSSTSTGQFHSSNIKRQQKMDDVTVLAKRTKLPNKSDTGTKHPGLENNIITDIAITEQDINCSDTQSESGTAQNGENHQNSYLTEVVGVQNELNSGKSDVGEIVNVFLQNDQPSRNKDLPFKLQCKLMYKGLLNSVSPKNSNDATTSNL